MTRKLSGRQEKDVHKLCAGCWRLGGDPKPYDGVSCQAEEFPQVTGCRFDPMAKFGGFTLPWLAGRGADDRGCRKSKLETKHLAGRMSKRPGGHRMWPGLGRWLWRQRAECEQRDVLEAVF